MLSKTLRTEKKERGRPLCALLQTLGDRTSSDPLELLRNFTIKAPKEVQFPHLKDQVDVKIFKTLNL